MNSKRFKNKQIYFSVIILLLLLLLSPLIFKDGFFNEVFTSEETYHNLILVSEVNETQSILTQSFNNNPFHVFLSYIPLSNVLIALLIPAILGILSLILVFLILKKLNLAHDEIIFVLILFSLVPIFLHQFTTLTPNNLAFPLALLSIILFLNKSYFLFIPLFLLPFINPFLGLIILLFIIIHFILKQENKWFSISAIIFLVASISTFIFLNLGTNFLIKSASLDDVLIELGSLTGYSVPLIILGVMGLFVWWKKQNEKTIIAVTTIIAFGISLFIQDIRIIVALSISVFAGMGLNYLFSMNWELEKIKEISLLLIACIILFSSIVTINTQIMDISLQEAEAAIFLANLPNDGLVISTESKGFMIQYLSQKETLLDGESPTLENYNTLKEEVNQIFYARNLFEVESLLNNYNISYLFIHQNMRAGEIWSTREEGLQFFLIYSNRFSKIFDNEQVQIYKYSPREIINETIFE